MSEKTALVIGATGLVGRELIQLFLATGYYKKIQIIARRRMEFVNDRLEYLILKDFGDLEMLKPRIQAQDFYCTLGTTIKQAGSKEAFEKVDYEYPMELARIAKSLKSFEQYLVVTAAGSNVSSPVFYNRVKGKLEMGLSALELKSLKIFRPSLLMGHREEVRIGEQLAIFLARFLSFFMVGFRRGLLIIEASDVAKAMLATAISEQPGEEIISSTHIAHLAQEKSF